MATLSKDEARSERGRVHSRRGTTCECGRVVYGNGRASHFRSCPPYLAKRGWTFSAAEMTVLRQQAREAAQHLPDGERTDAWLKYLRDAAMDEARSRGLLPAEG
jgi:hypothetical protein